MSFFSDDRGSELRDLFFESASELLQVLNEDGLKLEKRPGDTEIVRGIRRTVHTLKGDSAACGFVELAGLAHELEDALTPELAKKQGVKVAELILRAADEFDNMLQAYRTNAPASNGDDVRKRIQGMLGMGAAAASEIVSATVKGPEFHWTEYEQLAIADAVNRGLKVLQASFTIDPNCLARGAAVQMVKNALQDLGTLLVMHPDDSTPAENVQHIEAAFATSFDEEYVAKKCRIPAIIADVLVQKYASATEDEDLLNILESVRSSDEPETAEDSNSLSEQDPNSIATLSSGHETTLRVDAEKIDLVLNLVGEMIIGKSMLTQAISEFDKKHVKDPLRAKFADALAFQARVLNDLQKSVMKVRMVPVEQLFRRFPRVVRDVSKLCEKEVQLHVAGQDTDLDKSILDVLAEPLAHLVRNAIGHGIETPEVRTAAGKPAHGTVKLDAYHQGNNVVIEVSDDGAGIDREKVVSIAIQRGVVTADEAARLTEGETLNLIFHPGFSTAEEVTSVSGRGVGMDVVKSVVERLKGTVSIDTRVGHGTKFYLRVPLTLAIIKALMFRVAGKLYAIPLNSVLEITRAVESDVHHVDQHEVIRLREEVLTLVRLRGLVKVKGESNTKLFVVVVALGDRKFGLVVDKLVGEEELVIKALDDHLVATEYVSGASILGDGTVVLILNLNAVVSKLGRAQSQAATA